MKQTETDAVPMPVREKAAYDLAAMVDKIVRRLSRYGGRSRVPFDERMAAAGVVYALASWWSILPEDVFQERRAALFEDIARVRAGLISEKAQAAERGASRAHPVGSKH